MTRPDPARSGALLTAQAAAFGVGNLVGCAPLFGFRRPVCNALSRLLRLDGLKVRLGADTSRLWLMPLLVFAELQAGRWLRTGAPYPLSREAIQAATLWPLLADLALGWLVVGLALGFVGAAITWGLCRRPGASREEEQLFQAAADRYLASGAFVWQYANGKLRMDPVYREVVERGLLPEDGTVVDLGCGRAFMLVLLARIREHGRRVWPPGWPPAPHGIRLCGVELRSRITTCAQEALGSDGVIEEGDVCTFELRPCRAVLLFDVLHMIPYAEQERILARIAASLEPGGVLVLREADAAGGWRFQIVRRANWAKGVFEGTLRRRFYFRSAEQWARQLEALGLAVRRFPLGEGMLIANVLIEARR